MLGQVAVVQLGFSGLDVGLNEDLANADILLDVVEGILKGPTRANHRDPAHLVFQGSSLVLLFNWGNNGLELEGKLAEGLFD